MDEIKSLRKYPKNLKLKDLNHGKYDLISLRKVNTKFGDSVIVKLDYERITQRKTHGELSDEAINKINKGNYKLNYIGFIDRKYGYKLEHIL